MKTFVINLDRRPDRLVEMTERLDRLGLDFERISGFDGAVRPVKDMVSWGKAFFYNNMKPPSPGVIGCYLSHRSIWQRIVDEKIPQALILEDDAELHDWDPKILEVSIADFGLDVLRLEASDLTSKTSLLNGTELLGRKFYDVQTSSAGAYLITQSGAKKYLTLGKFWIPADVYDLVALVTGLKSAVLLPVMSKQGGSVSDLSVPKPIATTQLQKAMAVCAEIWWRLRRPWLRAIRNLVVAQEARKRRKNLVSE